MTATLDRKAVAQRRHLHDRTPRNRRRDLYRNFLGGERRDGYGEDRARERARLDRDALRRDLATWHEEILPGSGLPSIGFVDGEDLLLVSGSFNPNEGGYDPDPDQLELEALAEEEYQQGYYDDLFDWFDEQLEDPLCPSNALQDVCWHDRQPGLNGAIYGTPDEPVNALDDKFWLEHELDRYADSNYPLFDPDRPVWDKSDLASEDDFPHLSDCWVWDTVDFHRAVGYSN
jgi:hypothetical protein